MKPAHICNIKSMPTQEIQVEEAVANGANGHKGDQEVSFDALIVGAGFAGLRMLYELRKRGVSGRVFDAASGVGGVSHVFRLFPQFVSQKLFLSGKYLTWLN
jgi:ribulose 1,5-bisphosphate synthetase/thiazole synthase